MRLAGNLLCCTVCSQCKLDIDLLQISLTSILTLDPLYCSYSALRVILACKSATKHAPPFGDFCHLPASSETQHRTLARSLSQGQTPVGTAAHQPLVEGQRWPQDGAQVQRHHLLLPKALPQGNLTRYFDLACITAGLRCLGGQQDAWEDAWLVLKHALGNYTKDGESWASH